MYTYVHMEEALVIPATDIYFRHRQTTYLTTTVSGY